MSMPHRGPTALHFTAIALTIGTLLLTAVSFLFYREAQEMRGAAVRAEAEQEKLVDRVRDLDDRIGVLKDVLGYGHAEVGQIDEIDASTVVGAARTDISRVLGRSEAGEPVSAREALARLARERDNLLIERDALVDSKSTALANYRAMERVWKAILKPEKEARLSAEKSLVATLREREEVLAEKELEIDALREQASEQRDQITELQKVLEEKDKLMVRKSALHRSTVRRLNRNLQKRDSHRFEKSDGKITLVDDAGRLVWVDLGAADKLRAGIRFSVFDRDAERVGGSRKGLKGVIEVVRVTGPHRSQARVIDGNRLDPLLKGDLVFSPIWSVGHAEHFALVGLVDLNDDGRSDIEGFRRYVQESGSQVSVWVDDSGERNGGRVDMRVKYLVVGRTPSPESARSDAQRAAYNRLIGHLTAMREEAYDHGVRVIRLNDFLTYIGYRAGLGVGVSVTREPAPPADKPATGAGRTSRLKRSPRANPDGVSGRFRKARGVKSPRKTSPNDKSPQ